MSFIEKIHSFRIVANTNTFYRGADSSELGLGDFPLDRPSGKSSGVWLADDCKTAAQYGHVYIVETKPNIKILTSEQSDKLAKEWLRRRRIRGRIRQYFDVSNLLFYEIS